MDANNEITDIVNIVTGRLDKQQVPYTIENRDRMAIIWLDGNNNFTCKIDSLTIGVSHLKGYKLFNLDQDEKNDLRSINDAIHHIFEVISHELVQEEKYKLGKLCSTKQYMVIEGKKVTCSGVWILHPFFFLPFVKKNTKIRKYNYSDEKVLLIKRFEYR